MHYLYVRRLYNSSFERKLYVCFILYVQYREIQIHVALLEDDQRKDVKRVWICEAERMRPFHLVEHGRIVVIGVVLVRTSLVVGFGTDLSVVVDDHLPVADLPLPADHRGGTIRQKSVNGGHNSHRLAHQIKWCKVMPDMVRYCMKYDCVLHPCLRF
jgi:hypothetical protein